MSDTFSFMSFLIILLQAVTSLIVMPEACDCSGLGGALILSFLCSAGAGSWNSSPS